MDLAYWPGAHYISGRILSTLLQVFQQPHQESTMTVIPTLELKHLRHREMKNLPKITKLASGSNRI